jgi:CheY-like chemotaxis protein
MPAGKEKDGMIHTMDLCKANCSFMTSAINRTVDFTKSASNIALSAKMETSSVLEAMQWAMNCVRSTEARIPIEMSPLPPGMCQFVVTDKHWLMENVLCYLSNGVKYSVGGTITINISLQDEEKDTPEKDSPSVQKNKSYGNVSVITPRDDSAAGASQSKPTPMLCISVEDEGIGVSDDMKLSLFQPFQQTMRLAGGTGLGLYSLAKRVEVLGGKYGISDRSDGRPGSRFWFTFPYVPDVGYSADITPVWSQALSRQSSQQAAASLRRASIPKVQEENVDSHVLEDSSSVYALVVEDSLVISKATKRMLSKAGYIVDVAENGAIGLEKMKNRVYNIVVMDLQMPIMDGLEATRRIRAFENEPSYIASEKRKQLIFGVSANGADDVRKYALQSGMDTFMPKPFSIKSLMEYQAENLRQNEDFAL